MRAVHAATAWSNRHIGVHYAASLVISTNASASPARCTSSSLKRGIFEQQLAHHALGRIGDDLDALAVARDAAHFRPARDRVARQGVEMQRMRRCATRARIAPRCLRRRCGRARVRRHGRPALRLLRDNAWSSTTAQPSPTSWRIVFHIVSRASISRPVVGSSRNRISACPQIASANCARRCWPPDSLP